MNLETSIKGMTRVAMDADGAITLPEHVRREAGLAPGMPIVVGINDRGHAVIVSRIRAKRYGETREVRQLRIHEALHNLSAGRYSTGQSTAEVMAELRGDPAA